MTDREYLEKTINTMRLKDMFYRETMKNNDLADKYKFEADRLQRILAVYSAAHAWNGSKHAGDASCQSGHCDNCTKPAASIELEMVCDIVTVKEREACGNG